MAASGTIYIQAGPSREQIKASSDYGNSWRSVTNPCAPGQPGKGSAGPLVAFTADRLSVTCVTQNRSPDSRGDGYERTFSDDGGRTWTRVAATSPPLLAAHAVSSTVAWASDANDIVRTIDGGHSWHTVWSATEADDGTLESLVAVAPDRAFAAFEIDTGHGTYFLIRATDQRRHRLEGGLDVHPALGSRGCRQLTERNGIRASAPPRRQDEQAGRTHP